VKKINAGDEKGDGDRTGLIDPVTVKFAVGTKEGEVKFDTDIAGDAVAFTPLEVFAGTEKFTNGDADTAKDALIAGDTIAVIDKLETDLEGDIDTVATVGDTVGQASMINKLIINRQILRNKDLYIVC